MVIDSCEVSGEFHPRFSKSRKTYEYRILNRRFPNPTRRLDTHFFHYPLDEESMQKAADYLVGEHDFRSFASVHMQSETSVRRIYDCRVKRDEDDIITISITGNRFLYNMVRAITGTVLYAAEGKFAPEDIPAILESGDRTAAGPTVPPGGLYLTKLWYEDERLNNG